MYSARKPLVKGRLTLRTIRSGGRELAGWDAGTDWEVGRLAYNQKSFLQVVSKQVQEIEHERLEHPRIFGLKNRLDPFIHKIIKNKNPSPCKINKLYLSIVSK